MYKHHFNIVFLLAISAATCAASTRDLKEDMDTVVVVGPFVDTAGGAVTAPTITSIDITGYRNNGTPFTISPAASGTSHDMVHQNDGYYSLELTANDVQTPGYLRLTFQISGALIFHEDFNILPANIYDSKYGSDKLEVDVAQISGDSAAADNAESFFDGTGYGSLLLRTTVSAVDSQTYFGLTGVTAASIYGFQDAILVIRKSDFATTKIVKYCRVVSFDAGDEKFNVVAVGGSGGLTTIGVGDTVDVIAPIPVLQISEIKAKTDNLPTDPADASDITASFATVNSSLATLTNYVDTEVAAIKTKTDYLPSATAGASGGLLISGSNSGTTTFNAVTITGLLDINNGVDVSCTTTNRPAITLLGDGIGEAIHAESSGGNAVRLIPSGGGAGLLANIAGDIAGNLSGSVGSVTGAVGSVTGAVGSVTGNVGGIAGDVNTFDELTDGAPTFADAMDDHGYTTARAAKLDNLDVPVSGVRSSMPGLLAGTTIATLASQTSFTLTAGPPDNKVLNGALIVITDATNDAQKAVGLVKTYVGSSRTVTLVADPTIFTMTAGDRVDIIAVGLPMPLWLGQ